MSSTKTVPYETKTPGPMAMPRRRALVGAVAALLLTSGCAQWQAQNSATKGVVYGAGAGAATGAAIGAIIDGGEGAGKGAAIGAIVGAVGGGTLGSYMDQQAADMQKILAGQDRIERRGETIYLSLAGDIMFETGKSQIHPGGADKLRDVAGILQRYPRTTIDVVGHTDNVGAEAYNQTLSEQRALSVRNTLHGYGVQSGRIAVSGMGETRPVSDNSSPEGRARNRRVDMTIRPDGSFQG